MIKVVSFTPRPLSPEERARNIHCVGGWVGPRTDLDNEESSRPCQDSNSDPSFVRHVASRYTDWAMPAPWELLYNPVA
jgi:hypothetical protein